MRSETFPSTCWECSAWCGSLVTVAEGRVTDIAPNRQHPYSKGAFCIKGMRGAPGTTYSSDRLLHPMRRAGPRGSGAWTRITWDEALDEIADRFAAVREQHGARSVIGAVSSAYFSRGLVMALMLRSIGSPNWMINQDTCGGCRAISQRVSGLDITMGEDVENSRTILIVGRNPAIADPVQWAGIKRAKQGGARIVVIDPKRTSAADQADLWLRPQPGTDAALALAMIDTIIREERYDRGFVDRHCHGFEALAARAAEWPAARASAESGVPAEAIVQAARLYADGPSSFVSGHGIDAISTGVQTFRAFHALVAITGNVDRPGGNRRVKAPPGFRGYFDILHDPEFRLPRAVEEQTIGADRFPLWAGPGGWQMACHNPTAIDAILTGRPYPVRAMYVSGNNILAMYPNTAKTIEALEALDFLVVAAQTLHPTAEFADIVLPKATSLEEEELFLLPSGPILLYSRPAHEPLGEARTEIDIAAPLLDRLEQRGAVAGRVLPWRSQREFNAFMLKGTGIDIEEIARTGYWQVPHTLGDFEGAPFRTPTGKIELFSETLDGLGLDPLPAYVPPSRAAAPPGVRQSFPLVLMTGEREKSYHHSRFRNQAWATKVSPDPTLSVHPATADELGVGEGDWVTLETPDVDGTCRLRVKVTDATLPGVVSTGVGWWRPGDWETRQGILDINVNAALTYDGPFDPASGSPDTRGILCRVRPVGNEAAAAAEDAVLNAVR